MIVLHVAPINWREVGGLRTSIPALVAAQNHCGDTQAALAVSLRHPGNPPSADFPIFHQRIVLVDRRRLNLPKPFDRPDLAVLHSTYIPAHATIAAQLSKAEIPYVICPRGGMTRYAQTLHRWKKGLANQLFFKRLVKQAAAVHCLTRGEAEASAAWHRPMFVAGNGIELPDAAALARPGQSSRRRLIFVGRLHIQYKGLDMLLEACRRVRSLLSRSGAVVTICGPDCGGRSRLRLSQQIDRLGLRHLVELYGPASGSVKALLLGRSDVFLHPSRSEGHPMAVLEALAYGLPCLLTPVTNMAEEVARVKAGWRVDVSPAAVAAGLVEAVTIDGGQLARAGARARQLAVEQYSWERAAAASVAAYRRWAA